MIDFYNCISHLQKGNRMLRPGWEYYLSLMPNQSYIWIVGNGNPNPTINATIYNPSINDILATDWIMKP